MSSDIVKFNDDGYNEDLLREVRELALLGLTDEQMSNVLGVSMSAFQSWKKDDLFRDALMEGKTKADAKVAAALYKRALGYDYNEEMVSLYKGEPVTRLVKRHVPPDPWSAARWLSTRQRGLWTESTRTEIMKTQIDITKIDLSGVTDEQLHILKNIVIQNNALEGGSRD